MQAVCTDYKALLDEYLERGMPLATLQELYFERFLNESRSMSKPLFLLLDGLFGDLDATTADPELLARDPDFYLEEARLRERVRIVAARLASFCD